MGDPGIAKLRRLTHKSLPLDHPRHTLSPLFLPTALFSSSLIVYPVMNCGYDSRFCRQLSKELCTLFAHVFCISLCGYWRPFMFLAMLFTATLSICTGLRPFSSTSSFGRVHLPIPASFFIFSPREYLGTYLWCFRCSVPSCPLWSTVLNLLLSGIKGVGTPGALEVKPLCRSCSTEI
jgi:hypothetical protein